MGKYLVRCFPSHPIKEVALNSAIEQIKLSRQGKPQDINASGKQREATNEYKKVWNELNGNSTQQEECKRLTGIRINELKKAA